MNVKHHPITCNKSSPKGRRFIVPPNIQLSCWDKHLNEQILINVENEKFSSEKDEMVDFLTRNTVINAVNEAKNMKIVNASICGTNTRKIISKI